MTESHQSRPGPRFFSPRPVQAWVLGALLAPLDRLFNRLYGWRYNPLYQSGTLAVVFLLTTVVTGLYQLYFYKLASPYESVLGLEAQVWTGRWIRALHSYAGDAMMVAVAVHALRMMAQGRTWGARFLAWVSGVLMVGVMLFSAWTGIILVWDAQGQLLAVEGARLIDLFPIFSEPIQRGFSDPRGMDANFFFLNLLLHMVFPVGLLFLLWLHTLRLARPAYLPPRKLTFWVLAGLILLSIWWPLGVMTEASALRMLGTVEVDLYYGWWLLLGRVLPPWLTLLLVVLLGVVGFTIPWWWRPPKANLPAPAEINEALCTGCTQCYMDCPYGAITMVQAPEGHKGSDIVAMMDTSLCVSCGICAGSCAPMLVGPPQRRGQDHLAGARAFMAEVVLPASGGGVTPGAALEGSASSAALEGSVVVMACEQGVAAGMALEGVNGVFHYSTHCVGAMHTSAMEFMLRRGVSGLYLLSCPERDCQYREGAQWMRERVYNDREAELHERVSKNRVRFGYFGRGQEGAALADITAFREALLRHEELPPPEESVEIEPICEPEELPPHLIKPRKNESA